LSRQALLQGTNETLIRHYTDALMGMSLPVDSQSSVLVAVGGGETWFAKLAARKIVVTVPYAHGVLVPNVVHV
jgi:hypothetical protein